LKRSLDGTHHHVSREHLPRYLREFDFRFSTRDMSDTARMGLLMGQVGGRRLAYKQTR
jgi:ISXO2-like transposase domain